VFIVVNVYFVMTQFGNLWLHPDTYRILVEKSERIQLRRPRRRWEDNIRMDLRAIGWEGVDWIHLAQDRDRWQAVVNTAMNLRVP
jgi:ribosome biogenesis protein Nip4